jgi:hypothetical protein
VLIAECRNTIPTTSRGRGSPASPWTGNGGPRRVLHGLSLFARDGASMRCFPSDLVVAATTRGRTLGSPLSWSDSGAAVLQPARVARGTLSTV